MTEQRAVRWFDVPAGTPANTCRGPTCGKNVFWIEYEKTEKCRDAAHRRNETASATCPQCGGTKLIRKRVRNPIDCDVEGGAYPTRTDPGRGVSHYTTCPDAGRFGHNAKRRG